ncbi:MAG: CxxC-x17-CxxC domain-containing protein [Candidatus Omnitrophota bacterium]
MKKRMKSKSVKSKASKNRPTKSKSSSASAAADQDIAVLLTTLVQKLASFEAKIDTVLSRIPSQPIMSSRQQQAPTVVSAPEPRRDSRPMHKVVCADCGINCEVPFKPSAGRPVFCKKCYAERRKNGTFKLRGDDRSKETPPVHALPPEKPQAVEPARSVRKKKPAAKKKKKNKGWSKKK